MRLSTFAALLCLFLSPVGASDTIDPTREQIALRSIGPAGMSGRITAIAVVPSDKNVWYIGSASGGLWKTTNAGITFEPIFDRQPVQAIGAVAVAPSNPDVVYAGTGEGNPRNSQSSGNGIYKSVDGGSTWRHLGFEQSRNVYRMRVHPENEDIVWAGILGDPFKDNAIRGLYKSVDGGESWKRVLYSNASSGIAELVMDPSNPDRLMAALWEFRRSPWDFVSGGEGSGLFISEDGGDSWQEIDAAAGLPEKPYGRIGLAIAPSNTDRVYALIESAKNALYRSDDGGSSWEMINTETIGSRPFYFSQIHVDSQNEDRVYNLYSRLARSENAGEDFEVIEDWGREVHADHHAFWIDPEDPAFIIDGTDGGLYWTRDRGMNWRFAENLPLGQFYHITLDNAVPYNVYGGLQDNGTWYGPSEVWNRSGIRNSYWRELAFNDGFDVVLDQANGDIAYALWQGGMLVRVNQRSGQRKTIMPVDPDEELRFNWNTAIAGDPFHPGALYIGSQFVHKSDNRGESWRIISPDLTSNDPDKQQQHLSGGLSIDATTAENHTTITVIAPSQIEEGLLWVGSDDGRLHLTRNGGDSWQDLSTNLTEAPAQGWIRRIIPSVYDVETAVVVIDNHLQGDWSPYVFQTTDAGRTWTNLLADQDIPSYALSFVQDPEEPELMFAGTEFGLYYSLDAGDSWTQWTRGYPSVSTMDMQIQTRERDLVLGTFGRSIWILDDLQPWRELAAAPALREKALHLFPPADTYQPVIDQAPGQRLSPDHLFAGDNNARQALISFWVNDPALESVEVRLEMAGRTLRQWQVPVAQGMNRTHWDLQLDGKEIYGPLMSPDLEMPLAAPGNYRVIVTAGDRAEQAGLTLLPDPKVQYDPDVYAENLAFRQTLESLQRQMDDVKDSLVCIKTQMSERGSALTTGKKSQVGEAINEVWKLIEFRDVQGVVSSSPRLSHQLARAFYFTHSPYEALTSNDRTLLEALQNQTRALVDTFNRRLWSYALTESEITDSCPRQIKE
ncbi:MAG: WD40/YVTN/BNR-like repeat-containing protein [Chromatocurvus sp.]